MNTELFSCYNSTMNQKWWNRMNGNLQSHKKKSEIRILVITRAKKRQKQQGAWEYDNNYQQIYFFKHFMYMRGAKWSVMWCIVYIIIISVYVLCTTTKLAQLDCRTKNKGLVSVGHVYSRAEEYKIFKNLTVLDSF